MSKKVYVRPSGYCYDKVALVLVGKRLSRKVFALDGIVFVNLSSNDAYRQLLDTIDIYGRF